MIADPEEGTGDLRVSAVFVNETVDESKTRTGFIEQPPLENEPPPVLEPEQDDNDDNDVDMNGL